MSDVKVTPETQTAVDAFTQADTVFKAARTDFEERYGKEIEYLDKLREERNALLDTAKKALRTEADTLDSTKVKTFRVGPFHISKPQTFFYSEKAIYMLKEKKLWDMALQAKVVAQKVEFAPFASVKAFLEAHGVDKDFQSCEDGKDLTPAIKGPKPVAGFGAEVKEA